MPIYNPPLEEIDQGGVRRYAGLRQKPFDQRLIQEACDEARLLAAPRGNYEMYEYDCFTGIVAGSGPVLEGKSIRHHLEGCSRIAVMTATAGGAVEQAVTDSFAAGRYAYSLLLDAAGTQAVEQIADEVEREIGRLAGRMGLIPRWRFSPGYGDWPLAAQREIASLAGCGKVGIVLTESLMLQPRKSITAVVGLGSLAGDGKKNHNCDACNKRDCPSRRS